MNDCLYYDILPKLLCHELNVDLPVVADVHVSKILCDCIQCHIDTNENRFHQIISGTLNTRKNLEF